MNNRKISLIDILNTSTTDLGEGAVIEFEEGQSRFRISFNRRGEGIYVQMYSHDHWLRLATLPQAANTILICEARTGQDGRQ